MDEQSPLESPNDGWWNQEVNRRETIWLGLTGAWALTLFGGMLSWTQIGEQNQTGRTVEVPPKEYRREVQAYKERAGTTTVNGQNVLVPPKNDLYIGAFQWGWDGLPAVLEAGTEYTFHLGAYDVQHGFSVRQQENMSQQISLQVLPGYEWLVKMEFQDPGKYVVICNEYCGTGHRAMNSAFYVREQIPEVETKPSTGDGSVPSGDYSGWFTSSAKGGKTGNYDGSPTDARGKDKITIKVGADGNGGTFAFEPAAVIVSPGTTVTFEWVSNNHNLRVESQPEGATWQGHADIENKGFSFKHTFDTNGVYKYYCRPHLPLGMKGIVEVK